MLAAHLQRSLPGTAATTAHLVYRLQHRRSWLYSLAMTAVEAFDSSKPPVTILASDIDTKVLAHAAAGIYELERLSGLDEQRKPTLFSAWPWQSRGAGKGQG